MTRDLMVTSLTPTLASGTGLRTYGVVAALARHRAVEVAYIVHDGDTPAPEYGTLENVRLFPLSASRGFRRGVEYARARWRGVPDDLARGVSPELAGAAGSVPSGTRVIADGPVVAGALLPLARRREAVYLAHNLESGFRGEGAALAEFERDVLRTFSESWMATRADQRDAADLAGEAITTRYVPNVVDVGRIVPVEPAGGEVLLFVGDFTYAPNRDGLRFLVDEVLPITWRSRPSVRLLVAGRGALDPPCDERNEVLGFVEDLRSVYTRADAAVVPLLRGGGSPLKFVEALAYGLPVIATRHAAGLLEDAIPNEHFLLAADPAEFARAVSSLFEDVGVAGRLGAAGRGLAERSYSIDALATLLTA
jgi:glycosyltransferase involved in cell wall biosynthesis